MKTIIFTAALSLLVSAARAQAQEIPPAQDAPESQKPFADHPTFKTPRDSDAPETVKKALPAAWLGIELGDTDGKVVVAQVAPDSPAAKAGLQNGDILVRIGDTPIEGKMERVIKIVTGKQPGEAIEVHWQRGDKEGATRVELGARPEPVEKDYRGEFRRGKEEAKQESLQDHPGGASAQTQMKSGIVDMKRVFEEYRKTKDAEIKINEEKSKARKDLDQRRAAYQKPVDEWEQASKIVQDKQVNAELKQQKQAKMQKLVPEIKALEREIDEFRRSREQKLRMRKGLLDDISKHVGEKSRDPEAFLGISVEPRRDGKLAVASVASGSPATKAGLKEGDLLLSIGGEPIKGDVQQFVQSIRGKKPGETIDLRWQRGDKEESARIKLSALHTATTDVTAEVLEEFRRHTERSKEEMQRNLGKLRLDSGPDPEDADKLLRSYLDKEWPGDKAGDKEFNLHLGKEVPLFERTFPGGAKDLKGFHSKLDTKEKQPNDDAIWKRVQKSVAGALEKSGVGSDVREKVMEAVEDARRAGLEEQNRRSQLEAEAAKLEKEMQNLKARADKLRDELKKAAE